MTTSWAPPDSRVRKREDNSIPFGGGSCPARRSLDVPGVVGCFVGSTRRVQESQWGLFHVRPILQVTIAAKSYRRSEVACWLWGRRA